jgi:glycosyltransferase involved in cell wall biosynthesis
MFSTKGTNSFSLGSLLSHKIGKPLVIGPADVAHDYDYDDFRLYIGGHSDSYNHLSFKILGTLNRLAQPFLSKAFQQTLDAANCIVVPNEAARRAYSNYVSSKKLKVIPTGARSFSYVERDPAYYPLILMIGNLIARKGYLVALEAMKKLLIEVPDAQLFIVGSGPLQQTIQKRVKNLGLERNVLLKGRVSDNELARLFAKAWVFCHASFSEAYSYTIPEAMSAGLPVVCTEIDGSDGMVVNGLNGFVVQPGDPDALAEALAEIISNRELALKMGELSKLKSKSYDWWSVSKEYYYVYQKLSGDT